MSCLGNIIWLIFGGLLASLGYIIGGLVMCITIIGIPFAKQHIKLVPLALFPFGRDLSFAAPRSSSSAVTPA